MFEYFEKIKKILNEVEKYEKYNIEKVVNEIIKAIKLKKSIYIFGASHAGILTQEMFYRAGGLMLINPIFSEEISLNVNPITHTSKMERLKGYGILIGERYNFKKGDILILHSVSGRNNVTIELAKYAKDKGLFTIGITNLKYSKKVQSRDSDGKKLYQIVDMVIDNHGELGDACLKIERIEQKVSPTSTVIGASIMNEIVYRVSQKIVEEGNNNPPIFYSANIDDGDIQNKKLYDIYKDLIHYKF
ncbi:SIS domain-containing protein [Oceanivirga salmonicida]|uniref:SIS domain-containing protein n=1 Tax=Oceanivirga salmonicida TaxID=1769291 RepID=UPI00082D1A53|nr:SIS domain-containing protein [Oceanivirga salmonicida]